MFGYLVRENVILTTSRGDWQAGVRVAGSAGTSAQPATASTQTKLDVRFRRTGQPLFMSNVEYLPVRTSDGSLVLRVVLLTPLERMRRLLGM
jgi:hypothetical protein